MLHIWEYIMLAQNRLSDDEFEKYAPLLDFIRRNARQFDIPESFDEADAMLRPMHGNWCEYCTAYDTSFQAFFDALGLIHAEFREDLPSA